MQIEVSLCDQELTTSTTGSEASHTPRTASAGTSDEGTALPAQSHGTLRVEYPSQPTMTLPISPSISQDQPTPATAIEGSGIVQAKVWEWRGDVWDEGDAAAEWFSTVLDEQVRCGSSPPCPSCGNPSRRFLYHYIATNSGCFWPMYSSEHAPSDRRGEHPARSRIVMLHHSLLQATTTGEHKSCGPIPSESSRNCMLTRW